MDSEFSEEESSVGKLDREAEQYQKRVEELRVKLGAVDPALLDEYTQALQRSTALQILSELTFLDSDDEIGIRFLFGLPVDPEALQTSLINWSLWKERNGLQ